MAALKTLSYDSDPEEAEGGSGDEDEDWQKTFAAMKKQYLAKAEEPVLPKKAVSEKRKNIALVEVRLQCSDCCGSVCEYVLVLATNLTCHPVHRTTWR